MPPHGPCCCHSRFCASTRALGWLSCLLPAAAGPLTLPLICPSQLFSFEINISVAIITFASKPKIILPVWHKNSQDVTEVLNHLDNINYKGIGVIKRRGWEREGGAFLHPDSGQVRKTEASGWRSCQGSGALVPPVSESGLWSQLPPTPGLVSCAVCPVHRAGLQLLPDARTRRSGFCGLVP